MALPPAFAAGALYDNLLQAALRQFFARATFESEPTPSISSDGRLAIEPTSDPAELTVRWFGSRHILRVPPWRPFTEHEVRLARSIGAVLATRYRAIFDPSVMALRGDLFRGAIEDRYIGTFLDGGRYALQGEEGRADRLSDAIEVLRVAALSSYENRAISSGVLHLEGLGDPVNPDREVPAGAYPYNQALTAIKSFYRLCDGLNTLFLVNREGVVLDIVEVQRWASERGRRALEVPCAAPYRAHASATLDGGEACIVLSPSHEIKVFAEGAQIFTFRNANWHLLDLEAKYTLWQKAVGKPALANRLFQTALDLSDAREGALFVILRDPVSAVPYLIAPSDRLDTMAESVDARTSPSRRDLLYLLAGRTATTLDRTVLEALATMDGATVMDQSGALLAVGAILMHPMMPDASLVIEGARTTAAVAAARFGPVLKVSEDGMITFYDGDRVWDI
jgi:hypothetical protein